MSSALDELYSEGQVVALMLAGQTQRTVVGLLEVDDFGASVSGVLHYLNQVSVANAVSAAEVAIESSLQLRRHCTEWEPQKVLREDSTVAAGMPALAERAAFAVERAAFAIVMGFFGEADAAVAFAGAGVLAKAWAPGVAVELDDTVVGPESISAVFAPFATAARGTATVEIAREGSDRTKRAGLGRRTGASNIASANGPRGIPADRNSGIGEGAGERSASAPDLGDWSDTSARARSGSRDLHDCHIGQVGCTRWGLDTAF